MDQVVLLTQELAPQLQEDLLLQPVLRMNLKEESATEIPDQALRQRLAPIPECPPDPIPVRPPDRILVLLPDQIQVRLPDRVPVHLPDQIQVQQPDRVPVHPPDRASQHRPDLHRSRLYVRPTVVVLPVQPEAQHHPLIRQVQEAVAVLHTVHHRVRPAAVLPAPGRLLAAVVVPAHAAVVPVLVVAGNKSPNVNKHPN